MSLKTCNQRNKYKTEKADVGESKEEGFHKCIFIRMEIAFEQKNQENQNRSVL